MKHGSQQQQQEEAICGSAHLQAPDVLGQHEQRC
jgi:hypothetical protein